MNIVEVFGGIGMALCAVAVAVLFALLSAKSRGHGSGRLLLLAVAVEFMWALQAAVSGAAGLFVATMPAGLLESARVLVWLGFLLSVARQNIPAQILPRVWIWGALTGSAILALGSALARVSLAPPQWVLIPHLILIVLAIAVVEQIWRNMPIEKRWGVKFLCLALLGKFVLDMILWADALLFLNPDGELLAARGFANAALVPLIAVAAARNPTWKLDIAVSRKVVLHTTTLMLVGGFLLGTGLAGYYLKYFGGSWGKIAATVLAFLSLLGLAMVVLSGTFRGRLRVYLSKNFFSYRYDYREEWLKFTALLSNTEKDVDAASIAYRALTGFCSLVDSSGGGLWLAGPDGKFHCESRLNRHGACPDVSRDDPLLLHIAQNEYLVEVADLVRRPFHYGQTALPGWLSLHPMDWLLMPLVQDGMLVGFAILQPSPVSMQVDWEVRDALKTSARQAASYLMLRRAVESLVEAQQFESYNQATTFLAHDLKNLVAQLSLMLRNVDRHGNDPEFQKDMVETVRNVLGRMQELLLQLRTGKRESHSPECLQVVEIIKSVMNSRKLGLPTASLEINDSVRDARIHADREKVERILGHLVQNAAEATSKSGDVRVRVKLESGQVVIDVEDTGVGMSPGFVKSRLFRPFSTTKPHGMGIGTFETRQYIQQLGGTIDVATELDKGTTFTVRLPVKAEDG